MNPAIREVMEAAIQNAVAIQSRPCNPEAQCTDMQCALCGGTGLIIPHRYSDAVMAMLSVDVLEVIAKFSQEEDWESIEDLAKWGQEYVTNMREHYFQTEFSRLSRKEIHALADNMESKAELAPQPGVVRKLARAMRECNGTYKDFARLKRKYLGC